MRTTHEGMSSDDEKALAKGETSRTGLCWERVAVLRGVDFKATEVEDLTGTRGLLYFGFFDGETAVLSFDQSILQQMTKKHRLRGFYIGEYSSILQYALLHSVIMSASSRDHHKTTYIPFDALVVMACPPACERVVLEKEREIRIIPFNENDERLRNSWR
jgi:hypothetical protein